MKDEERKHFCWPHSSPRENTWRIGSYEAFHWKRQLSSCLQLPSLFHRCNSLSETAHKPCTLAFYKHRFLTPLEHHLISCSCCSPPRYGSALLDFCQSFSLQHMLSSSVAFKKKKTTKNKPPKPLHTSLQTRGESLIPVTTYILGSTQWIWTHTTGKLGQQKNLPKHLSPSLFWFWGCKVISILLKAILQLSFKWQMFKAHSCLRFLVFKLKYLR